jgi:hypothetical protein
MTGSQRPSDAELRRGEAAGWGGKPQPRPTMRLLKWRSMVRGSLLGFADVELPIGLKIFEIPVLSKGGTIWAGMPGKVQLDKDGNTKRDARVKIGLHTRFAMALEGAWRRFLDATARIDQSRASRHVRGGRPMTPLDYARRGDSQ